MKTEMSAEPMWGAYVSVQLSILDLVKLALGRVLSTSRVVIHVSLSRSLSQKTTAELMKIEK